MTFSVLDYYLNTIFIKNKLERLRRELTFKISLERQISLLLLDDDPLRMFLISQMPEGSRHPLCLLFLFWRQVTSLFDDEFIEDGQKASALQGIASLINSEIVCEENRDLLANCESHSPVLFWSLDVLVTALGRLSPREAKILISHCSSAALGLADFVGRKILHTCVEYNLYCYYRLGWLSVAAIQILCCAHADNPMLANVNHLAGSIGVLTAKTICIKGPPRLWPLELTDPYQAGASKDFQGTTFSLCRRRMILDAFRHLVDVYQLFNRLGSNQILCFFCSDVLESAEILAAMYHKGTCDVANYKIAWHYTIFKNVRSLTDFQHSLTESIISIDRALRVDDPLHGQMSLLAVQLMIMCGRRRQRSICDEQWHLTLGALIELSIYSLSGLVLSLIIFRYFS